MNRVNVALVVLCLQARFEEAYGEDCFIPTVYPKCEFENVSADYKKYISQVYRLETDKDVLYLAFRNKMEQRPMFTNKTYTLPSSVEVFKFNDDESVATVIGKIHYSEFEKVYHGKFSDVNSDTAIYSDFSGFIAEHIIKNREAIYA